MNLHSRIIFASSLPLFADVWYVYRKLKNRVKLIYCEEEELQTGSDESFIYKTNMAMGISSYIYKYKQAHR